MTSQGRRDGGHRWASEGTGVGARPDAASPGWQPDPEGRFEKRFHDGQRWTSRVRVGEAVAIDTARETGDEAHWYRDPTGRFERRAFVDGRWTKRVRMGDAVAVDTEGVPAGQRHPRGAASAETTSGEREPGWYPDPRPRTRDGRDWWDPRPDLQERERYWDGYQWTAKIRRPGGRRERGAAELFMSRALMILIGVVVVLAVGVVSLIVLL